VTRPRHPLLQQLVVAGHDVVEQHTSQLSAQLAAAEHRGALHDLAVGMTRDYTTHPVIETHLQGPVMVSRCRGDVVVATGLVARLEFHDLRATVHLGTEVDPEFAAMITTHEAVDLAVGQRVTLIAAPTGPHGVLVVDEVISGA
jgi:hypothetical protein